MASVISDPARRTPGSLGSARLASPPAARSAGLFEVRGLYKSYRRGSVDVPVLRGVDLTVGGGELLSVVGQSGSGKSTLLHLMATLDTLDRGQMVYAGQSIESATARVRDRLRNREFGMVFQFYHLLPELTALENVLLPELIDCGFWSYWRRKSSLRNRAQELIDRVGLSHRAAHRPCELSGGEMQRVAIARALMAGPNVLFADEPTGNLDRQTGEGILDLLQGLNRDSGLTIVLVTHDLTVAQRAHRTLRLVEGRVEEP
ncbi:MAG TPA: ABC transporter ATP-binding protein [Pirellulaceae bacterium]